LPSTFLLVGTTAATLAAVALTAVAVVAAVALVRPGVEMTGVMVAVAGVGVETTSILAQKKFMMLQMGAWRR
jgi:hypothetical protein